jgi:hypothetical protein
MVFLEKLRDGIRRGEIRSTIRIWQRPHVRVGGRYSLPPGHVVVDSLMPIELRHVTGDMARESGFDGLVDLLKVAQHGTGRNVYFITFHYVGEDPGAA